MAEEYLEGIVARGRRMASGLNDLPASEIINDTIRKQKPFFERVVPRIAEAFNGTVNIDVSPTQLTIIGPDHEITCEWEKDITETFWLVEASLRHLGRDYQGWMYYPCPGPLKKHNNGIIEFLAPPIGRLSYGDSVRFGYSPDKIHVTR